MRMRTAIQAIRMKTVIHTKRAIRMNGTRTKRAIRANWTMNPKRVMRPKVCPDPKIRCRDFRRTSLRGEVCGLRELISMATSNLTSHPDWEGLIPH